jgi:hypothetical protein
MTHNAFDELLNDSEGADVAFDHLTMFGDELVRKRIKDD